MSQHEGMQPGDGELTEPLVDPRAPWEELVEDPSAPRKLLAVLFTDIVGSTELATALGDKRWRELLEQHDAAIRAQLARFGGREVDTAGDAFFATFELPVRAVDCALESMRAVRRLGLRIRAGVHMGECVVSEGKVRGVSVHIGARVAAKARGDELLVSSTVRDILAGAGLKFLDRDEQTLKGVDGRWRLHAVEPRERDNEADLPPLLELGIAQPPPPWWKRRKVVVAGLTALAVLVGAIAFATLGGGGLSSVPADSVALIDAGSLTVKSSTKVGARPVGLAPSRDGVWVTNSFDRSVSLVSKDGKSVTTIGGLGASPSSAAVVGNLLWVANIDGKTISRLSPQTKAEVGSRIQSGNGLTDIAFGAGAIWATHSVDGTVWRMDAKSGTRTHSIGVGPSVRGLAVTDKAVWVASEVAQTVTRIDPRSTSIVAVIPVGHGPRAVAVGAGAVWVANAFDATVSRVDESSGHVVATVRVGSQPRAVAVAGGRVFVANEGDATVSVIDPDSNREIRKIPLVNAPMALAADGDRVWVSVRGGSATYRGGTLRVGTAVNHAPFDPINAISFDPGYGSPQLNFEVTAGQFGGLVGFKKTGGVEGAEVVPDLAEDLRPPTDGGKTYSFTLREGLRYSDGSPVRAIDVRKSIERLFFKPINYPSVLYLSIVGADKCTDKVCVLSQGIVTDDTARTVVFHLKQPNADFPTALALPWASVIPAQTPTHDMGLTPIPGTGPYRIANAKGDPKSDGGEVTLDRNPYFRPRGLAQPGGFADHIVVNWGGTPLEHVQMVKDGREDFTIDAGEPEIPIDQIAVEVPAQLHLYEFPSIVYAVLDRGSLPFRDVRVRKALNFAIDRKAVAEAMGAPLSASETCQVLPKNFTGYQPICPYTISPNGTGAWTGPDLATARRLVAQSKTAGTHVTVWTAPYDDESRVDAAQIVARALRSIGYPTDVREIGDDDDIVGELLGGNELHRQVRVEGWGADYPAPSTFFLPLLSCDATIEKLVGPDVSFNLARFCSQDIDRKMERALDIQRTDAKAAGDLWAEIDRAVVEQAPWVPLGTLRVPTLVSPRIGNVLLNPALGPIVSQMWVTETATNSPQPS